MSYPVNGPARKFNGVSAHDTTDFAVIPKAIFVGNGGDVVVVSVEGEAETFENVPDGSILPVICKRVNATGTTASGLIALYD